MFKKLLLKNSDERNLILFFAKLFLIWLSWKVIIYILGEESFPLNERLFPTISSYWETFNYTLAHFIIDKGNSILQLMGYKTYMHNRSLKIIGSGGIEMGNYCIGLQLMYYYCMLIIITPISFTKKLISIPSGIIITFLLNISRVVGLSLVSFYSPQHMAIAHDHIFNIIVFGTLMGIYYYLIKENSTPSS